MVNMNEDFGAYKDSIWKGLTARELGVMAVSAVSCGIIIILLYFILGWNLYISFLIGTAVAAALYQTEPRFDFLFSELSSVNNSYYI